MPYDYIKRNYEFKPEVGRHVLHTVTKNIGKIAKEDPGQSHYVQVKFGVSRHALPCHPGELEYLTYREDDEFMGHPLP